MIIQIISMIVIIILLLLVYYYFKKNKGITTGLNDARYYKYIDPKDFGLPVGPTNSFATSIWVYIKDNASGALSGGGTTSARIIYYIGSNELAGIRGQRFPRVGSIGEPTENKHGVPVTTPNMFLTKNLNDVMVMVGLDGNDPTTLKIIVAGDEEFSINDFPLQTWVNITLSVYNSSLDLYINGKLVSSKIKQNLLIEFPDSDETIVSLGNPFNVFDKEDNETDYTSLTTGFSGYTSRFKFFNNSLTPNEAYDIYKSGPGSSSLVNMIGSRGLDINFKNGQEVTSTISI